MKRSRSGTPPAPKGPRAQTILLLIALAVVVSFAASAIFGLRRSSDVTALDPAAADTASTIPLSASRGRVEVLNGAGKAGLAKLATEKLRDAGFDVVQFGNARTRTEKSSVLDRVGNPDLATEAGRALGISDIKTAIDTTRFVDATVVIGKDWPAHQRAPR